MLAAIRRRPLLLFCVSAALAVAGLVLVAWAAGFRAVGDAFAALHPDWLVLVAAAQVVALAGYATAYRCAATVRGGPSLDWASAARLVVAGFAPFAPRGGFTIDQRALRALANRHHPDERHANVRVLGLGSLEYALLAPAAWICGLIGLTETRTVPLGFSLPWSIAVPVGFGVAVWAAHPSRRKPFEKAGSGRLRRWMGTALAGVDVLRRLAFGPPLALIAFAGMALYWAADIASFYGALRAVGAAIGVVPLVLAYASGYAATRRTLPLGGVIVTEILLAYFTSLMNVGFGVAVAAVAIYRAANLIVPAIGALESWPRVMRLVERAERRVALHS